MIQSLQALLNPSNQANICRFCMATTEEVQVNAVSDGTFFQRTKTEHDIHVRSVMQNDSIDSH